MSGAAHSDGDRAGAAGTGNGEPGEAGSTAVSGLADAMAGFAAAPSVRRWLGRSGDAVATAERTADLEMLQRFCASIQTDPDELVAQCLRSTKSGTTAISAAGRRKTDEAITAFVASEGATGRDSIVLANKLRGFLIHNGIFMQGSAAID